MGVEKLNQLIGSMGAKFRAEMTRPSGLVPTRFPVNQSFALAATHHFLTCPDAIRRILMRTTPEELAQRGKRLGTLVSPLNVWMLGYHFLVGREVLLDLEELDEGAQASDIATVLDCWQRLSFAHRGDGHLDNSDAGSTNRFLPSPIVQQLYRALLPVDGEIRRRLGQFIAALEEYLFILNAEARLGIADSGPYPLSASQVLIVRDFFDLKGVRYPWRDAATDLPYYACSLAFTLDPADFQSLAISDRALLVTAPSGYMEAIREIALLSTDNGTLRVLPFTEMDWLTRAAKKAQPRVLAWFERRSRRERITSGALPWIRQPFTLLAGEENPLFWNLAPAALRLLPSYENDDAQALRWVTRRCFAPGASRTFAPVRR
jgi:hypothetical protein